MAHHVERLILHAEHLGHRGTEYVGIKKSYTVTLCGKRNSEIDGHGRFAHATLAGADADDVLHARQKIWFLLGSRLTELHRYAVLHIYITRYVSGQCGLRSTYH